MPQNRWVGPFCSIIKSFKNPSQQTTWQAIAIAQIYFAPMLEMAIFYYFYDDQEITHEPRLRT